MRVVPAVRLVELPALAEPDVRRCGPCGGPVAVEVVPCVDGHGQDCPDVVCTGCGGVSVSAVVPSTPDATRLAEAA